MNDIALSPDQKEAVEKIAFFLSDECPDKELALSGRAGSGKSTIVKYAIQEVNALNRVYNMVMDEDNKELRLVYTAATNQAARVLENFVGAETKTIHNFLGLRVLNDNKTGETHTVKTNDTEVKKNSIIVVDEASMIDNQLLKLIRQLTRWCKILYVGDHKQLPPVKHTRCPVFEQVDNIVTLNKVHRQKPGPLLNLGESYRKTVDDGIFPPLPQSSPQIELIDGATFQTKLAQYFQNPGLSETRVLAYTNHRVNEYNAYIKGLHSNATHHEVGDYVITNKPIFSKKDMYATDSILRVTGVGPEYEEYGIKGRKIEVNGDAHVFQANDFKDVKALLKQEAKDAKEISNWSYFFKLKDFFGDLRNVYASTVHKAQGQTYKTIFVDLEDIGECKKWQDVARMLYVAFTRPTDKVYIYGDLPSRFYKNGNKPKITF